MRPGWKEVQQWFETACGDVSLDIKVRCVMGDESGDHVCLEDGFERVSRSLVEDLISPRKVRIIRAAAIAAVEVK